MKKNSKKTILKMDKSEIEYLKICLRLSDEQRLKWLEEANRFIYEALPNKTWKLRMETRKLGW